MCFRYVGWRCRLRGFWRSGRWFLVVLLASAMAGRPLWVGSGRGPWLAAPGCPWDFGVRAPSSFPTTFLPRRLRVVSVAFWRSCHASRFWGRVRRIAVVPVVRRAGALPKHQYRIIYLQGRTPALFLNGLSRFYYIRVKASTPFRICWSVLCARFPTNRILFCVGSKRVRGVCVLGVVARRTESVSVAHSSFQHMLVCSVFSISHK